MKCLLILVGSVAFLTLSLSAQNPHLVVYQGDRGPGVGKHIVFLAGDHEYRSEETLPALARILARRYGFKSSVFFTTDPKTGFIEPGSSNLAGLDVLKTADLAVIFLRFQDFPDAEMSHIVDYLDRGGPVMGLRTATHAFQIQRPDAKYLKYTWRGVEGYAGGFGRQILGETWVSHYGTNHKQSSRLVLAADQSAHPILRGVKDVWVQSGGYTATPIEGSRILARGLILDGMSPEARPRRAEQLPVSRTARIRVPERPGVVRLTTCARRPRERGLPADVVNGALWSAGLEVEHPANE
jgi:hypothetical protein